MMQLAKFKLILAAMAIFFFALSGTLTAQKKTIILVRHAEKAAPTDDDGDDPDLTPAGRQRAERLAHLIKKYRPQAIYVSEYKRTRQTAEPIARMRKIEIQTYDTGRQQELVDQIINSKTANYLVVGHTNTIPVLANLIFKKDIFKQLADSEYSVFWIIRLNRGVVKRVEVFPF